jgi:hypothetical protein
VKNPSQEREKNLNPGKRNKFVSQEKKRNSPSRSRGKIPPPIEWNGFPFEKGSKESCLKK